HQVKRMLAAVNNRVLALHRERVGTLSIDSTLAEGEYRALTETEIASFNELKGQPQSKSSIFNLFPLLALTSALHSTTVAALALVPMLTKLNCFFLNPCNISP